MSDYVLSATLELRDKFSAQVKKAKSGFTDFERSLRGTAAAVDNAAASIVQRCRRQNWRNSRPR